MRSCWALPVSARAPWGTQCPLSQTDRLPSPKRSIQNNRNARQLFSFFFCGGAKHGSCIPNIRRHFGNNRVVLFFLTSNISAKITLCYSPLPCVSHFTCQRVALFSSLTFSWFSAGGQSDISKLRSFISSWLSPTPRPTHWLAVYRPPPPSQWFQTKHVTEINTLNSLLSQLPPTDHITLNSSCISRAWYFIVFILIIMSLHNLSPRGLLLWQESSWNQEVGKDHLRWPFLSSCSVYNDVSGRLLLTWVCTQIKPQTLLGKLFLSKNEPLTVVFFLNRSSVRCLVKCRPFVTIRLVLLRICMSSLSDWLSRSLFCF